MKVAIITAITPEFLDQFKLLISSLRQVSQIPLIAIIVENDKPIAVGQKYDCIEERIDAELLTEYKKAGDRWIQWHKPDLIKKIADKYHLDLVLWLDADIVVLHDISPIILNINKTFTVMQDYFAPLTTFNDPKLYDLCPSSNVNPEKALNSGVVGMVLPRDKHILDEWIYRSHMAVNDEAIKECISLYDQGTLIWALKELNALDLVIDQPSWNHAPKRHAYEALPNPMWPFGNKTMGGDLFSEIRYDNPNAIIVHFAGHPKLTDLLIHNHRKSVVHNSSYAHAHNISNKHLFVVGLERAGTHTLAEIIRRSVKHNSWVRHEASTKDDYLNTTLSLAALSKYRGTSFDYEGYINKRIEFYDRKDVNIICDSNHRLGFFIKEIKSQLPNAKFILSLRSPLNLIKSRLANYCLWPALIHKLPIEYQLELYKIHTHFNTAIGSKGQNLHRIFPIEVNEIINWEADIIQMHVWEIVTTINFIMSQLSYLPTADYKIIWIDNLSTEIIKIRSLINEQYLKLDEMHKWSHQLYGTSRNPTESIRYWIDDCINSQYDYILSQFANVLAKYNIDYCESTII